MSRYVFDDLLEVAELNPKVFGRFPTSSHGLVPSEETVSRAEDRLGVKFPEDYRRMILKWGYLELGSENGFLGLFDSDSERFEPEGFNVVDDTLAARDDINLPGNCLVIFNDPGDGDEYGVIDVETGKVLTYDRWDGRLNGEVSDCFIDYVFSELIEHRRSNEIAYDTPFQWPEYLKPKIDEDAAKIKNLLDEYDEVLDEIDSEMDES